MMCGKKRRLGLLLLVLLLLGSSVSSWAEVITIPKETWEEIKSLIALNADQLRELQLWRSETQQKHDEERIAWEKALGTEKTYSSEQARLATDFKNSLTKSMKQTENLKTWVAALGTLSAIFAILFGASLAF